MRVWGSCAAASCFGGSDAAAADPTAAAAAVAADWHRAHHKPWGDKPHQGPRAAAGTACCWGELPAAAVAAVLARLPLAQRCQLATVCRAWAALVASAAAHDRPAPWDIVQRCPGVADWLASRALPCELLAMREEDQLRQLHCKATRHVGSATVWLVGSACVASLAALTCLTRLELLDPRCDADGALLKPGTPLKLPPPACLGHLGRLRVLTLSLAGPLVDLTSLPPSLQALHLNLASGFSVRQLRATCGVLGACADRLPQLRHISVGCELDALLRARGGNVLDALSELTQLTSLALTDYQPAHRESPAHEGYSIVPHLLGSLPRLHSADLRICSGQDAHLEAAAAVPDVRLVLTLARHEQTPFNRLPSTLTALSGLTQLTLLTAEFVYNAEQELFVFDAAPLQLCKQLRVLLLELHGTKAAQHDLRGLQYLSGLQELTVLLKCGEVHEARPEIDASLGCSTSGASSASGGEGSGGPPGSAAPSEGSSVVGRQSRWMSWLARRSGGLRSLVHSALAAGSTRSCAGTPLLRAPSAAGGQQQQPHLGGVLCEEWVLALLDSALDQLRPEFALSVPQVSGRLLIATTSRLLLRQPAVLASAREPLLLAAHLQVDAENDADEWSGQCFLQRLGPSALRAWVARQWTPLGLVLHESTRYPELGCYPGATQRIDDRLLTVSRRGTTGGDVVATVMSIAEERCIAYFA